VNLLLIYIKIQKIILKFIFNIKKMNLDNKIMSLTVKISNLTKELDPLIPKEISPPYGFSIGPQHFVIPSESQPNNGNIYMIGYNTTSITLPNSSNFTNPGFRLSIFKSSGSSTEVRMASINSQDVVTFESNTRNINQGHFILSERGFVELVWTSGGWFVTGSYDFTFYEPNVDEPNGDETKDDEPNVDE
jgi:hypothetical protein